MVRSTLRNVVDAWFNANLLALCCCSTLAHFTAMTGTSERKEILSRFCYRGSR